MPSIFISHGAPTLVIETGRTVDFLRGLGARLPRPSAILCISAHWETQRPSVSGNAQPPTIHDFFGFPAELYEMSYPAPGDPAVAQHICAVLGSAGFDAVIHPTRGLDHGAWVPLKLAYPQADIPVVQLSVQPGLDARHHLNMGRALRPLRDAGLLILGSGSATHNLRELANYAPNAAPPDYVLAFEAWLTDAITHGNEAALADYVAQAPQAQRNHPTPEHFLPLLVAMGAGDGTNGEVLHQDFSFGILSMAAYSWN